MTKNSGEALTDRQCLMLWFQLRFNQLDDTLDEAVDCFMKWGQDWAVQDAIRRVRAACKHVALAQPVVARAGELSDEQERRTFERAHKDAGYGAVKWNSDGDRPLFQSEAARYAGWQLAREADRALASLPEATSVQQEN